MKRVTPQEYQQRLISELTQLVPSLADFIGNGSTLRSEAN